MSIPVRLNYAGNIPEHRAAMEAEAERWRKEGQRFVAFWEAVPRVGEFIYVTLPADGVRVSGTVREVAWDTTERTPLVTFR